MAEDASPDSCFGLIALLALLNGVPADALPSGWVRHVGQWERGDSRVGDPFRAWGPLLAALAHRYWEPSLLQPDPSAVTRKEDLAAALAIGRAWLACLRFTLALLQTDSPPDPIQDPSICPEAGRAHA